VGSTPLHVLRINARELLRVPGTDRPIDVELLAADLGIDDAGITGPVHVDLTATSTIDGICVDGTITMAWRTECRRCLAEVTGVSVIDVDEVYQDGVGEGDDAFPIDGDQVDLAPAVREHLLLDLPDDVVCRDDCAGICPVCGTDRNTGSCDCDTAVRDERWAALDDLRLDD
jgi:uncharacterized protein